MHDCTPEFSRADRLTGQLSCCSRAYSALKQSQWVEGFRVFSPRLFFPTDRTCLLPSFSRSRGICGDVEARGTSASGDLLQRCRSSQIHFLLSYHRNSGTHSHPNTGMYIHIHVCVCLHLVFSFFALFFR